VVIGAQKSSYQYILQYNISWNSICNVASFKSPSAIRFLQKSK